MIFDRKVLIVGGNGFVGSNLSNFLNFGHIVADNFFLKKKINGNILNLDINFAGDEKWNSLFDENNIEVVLNLAAIHSIPYCNKNPEKAIYTNAYGNSKLFDFCLKKNVKHYIFASTGAVYKPAVEMHTEKSIVGGSDIYSFSKILAEKYVKDISSQNRIKTTVLRLFNIVGPNDFTPHLLPDLYDQFNSNKNKLMVGNLNTKRDYIHVDDVCNLINLALNSSKDYRYEEFNICTGIAYSGFEILNVMAKILDSNKETIVDKSKLRKSDRPCQLGSFEKANKFFGWEPEKTLEQGMNDYIKWKKKF